MMNSFGDFLRLRNEIGKVHLPRKFDAACLQLLDLIVIAALENRVLSVGDAYAFTEVGSHSTIHKKLQILRDFDFVSASFETNKRTKVINLTDKSRAYYDEIAAAYRPGISNGIPTRSVNLPPALQ